MKIISHILNKLRPKPIIPENLDEALKLIIDQSREADLQEFAAIDEDSPGAYLHFGAGMAMRNAWRLWHKDGPLNEWFRANGIWHGDDKSAIIYKALYCKLKNKPFSIEDEVRYYKLFWLATAGIEFDGVDAKLTPDERREAKANFKKEEARRYSGKSKRRVILHWTDVIDRDLPPARA
jgi:hypothetical protein